MAILSKLIADIWADPYCFVKGTCPSHQEEDANCIWCRATVIARWDVELARRILCLRADYSRANLHLLLRHMQAAGIEHHWEDTIATVRRIVVEECPFDPDLPTKEV